MTFGLMRRAGAAAAISAAMLTLTLSTADASPLAGQAPARTPVTAEVRAGSFDGNWIMEQSRAHHITLFMGAPDAAGNFTGLASWEGNSGNIDGRITGDDVVFFIHWSFGHTGRYSGHQGPDGLWSGVTIDLNDPSSQDTWVAHRA